MVSKAKLYSRLDHLEDQLRDSLVPQLRQAAAGNNEFIFCVKAFNEYRDLKDKTDKLTEELIEIGSQVLLLRDKLGESSHNTIAERICWYCREWSNQKHYQKSLAAALAKQFLAEIEK